MRIVLLSLLLFSSFLQGEIRECSTMMLVEQEANADTLVIFDIDNTLIRSSQMLGSDSWFWSYLAQKTKEMGDEQQALDRVIDILHAVYAVSEYVPVESATPETVRTIQKRGISCIVLTTRSPDVVSATFSQLKGVRLDFSNNGIRRENLDSIQGKPGARYIKGVLFCNNQHKGEVLLQFLGQINHTPKRIIFVDDRQKYVDQVAMVEKEGIEYLGFRYSCADEFIKNFDPEIARIQLERFFTILSDEEAARIKKAV